MSFQILCLLLQFDIINKCILCLLSFGRNCGLKVNCFYNIKYQQKFIIFKLQMLRNLLNIKIGINYGFDNKTWQR